MTAPALRGASVRDALDSATTALSAAGVDTPRLDAELLLAEALAVGRERLHSEPELPVEGAPARRFGALVRRRAFDREPIAYILGQRGFRSLELCVDGRVLIPRPETELLVEVAIASIPPGAHVLDVGTGSGAVALALAQERPDLTVAACDVSAAALEVARANAARLGLAVSFTQADLVAPGRHEAIVANLPYVASAELERLAPEIVRHEPRTALDGGPDGLATIRRLIAVARAPLLALEIGAGQADAVARLLPGAVERHRDLAGIERVLVARR